MTTAVTTTPVPGARTTTQARAAALEALAARAQAARARVAVTTAGTAATTVAATTTERETTGARPERSGVSVRVRITAVVALLTLLALTGAGLIVYVIEAQRIDQDISDRVDQQFREFKLFQEQEGASFATVGEMLDAFLEVEVPADDTALVSWYDGGPQNKSADGYLGEDMQVFRSRRVRDRRGQRDHDDRRPQGRADPQRADGPDEW